MPVLPRPPWLIPLTVAWALCLLGLLTAGTGSAVAGSGAPAKLVRIGSAPVLPSGTQPLAAAASSQSLRVTVALKPRHATALSAYAEAVADPSSSDYREYLSPARFAARFGASAQTITQVTRALVHAGLRPHDVGANHLSLDVVAPAGSYERAFHLELAHVLLPDRHAALVNLQAPALPTAVASDVQAVIGLDGLQTMRASLERPRAKGVSLRPAGADLRRRAATPTAAPRATDPVPEPCAAATTVADQQGAYTADQIASAYRFDGLYATGDEGAGVSIGVYELEPDSPADIAAYQSCYGTRTAISYTKVDGGAGSGGGSGEAAFDIEQIIGLAPKANIIVYQGPNAASDAPGSGPYDIFARMVSDDKVSIITNSWGECEAELGARDAHAENTLFEEAAIQGQSVLSAASDTGSEDCDGVTSGGTDALAVDDPASQPFVTGVGGTSLTALGPPPTETVWNSGGGAQATFGVSSGAGAGGGGVSGFWTMPAYQSRAPVGLNVVNPDSSASRCGSSTSDCREVPDVSAGADPAHGYLIYYNGDRSVPGEPSGWQATGGTSGAAPLWAAVFAEANSDPACAGTSIGFANPALYRAAATAQDTYFNDITGGDNDFTGANGGLYPATPGYDMASGLGSPNVTALASELCDESLRLTAPVSLQSFVGTARSLSVTTADASANVTVSVRGLPAGVRFDAAGDEISGTPSVPGSYTVSVAATDTGGALRVATFVWDVAAPPSVSRLSLTGVAAGRPVLSLRFSAGRSEAPLSGLRIELPAGLSLARAAKVTVRSLRTGKLISHTVSGAGRRVVVRLKRIATPVVVRFAAGSLRASGGLRSGARRARKPAYHVSAVVRDSDGALSTVRGSAKVTT